jgi:quercetin dioxygenase-like cupin family protein
MRFGVILAGVILAAMSAAMGVAGHGAGTLAQGAVISHACAPAGEETATPEALADSTLPAGMPSGLIFSVLADRPADEWPEFAGSLVLTVRHLTLDPGAVTDIRRTQGPLLFYVESGEVGISVNGQLEPHGTGASRLVETGQNYLLRNESAEPASLLRLALVPPEEETTVGRGDIAQVIDGSNEIIANAEPIASRLLLSADVAAFDAPMRLFLACLAWSDPTADPGEGSRPGPVGFLVLDGQLLIGESGALEAGSCTLFPPDAPRRLRAGDPAPSVLVFGAVPEGASFWTPAGEASEPEAAPERLTFECGAVEEPGEAPSAAYAKPRAPLVQVFV